MHDNDWLLLAAFFLLVLAPAPFLGRYFYRVMEGQRTWLSPLLQPLERACYRVAGIDPQQEQGWRGYSLALLAFTLVCLLVLTGILLLQGALP
ncbi:potassium-transporting ATPase subunit KdpA, partial [Bowmanella yangjiangensis]